jgi:hypothetical protein
MGARVKFGGQGILFGGLENLLERSSRGSREALERGAKDIAKRAVEYAPVDYGYLEESIKTDKRKDPANRRMVYRVYVDYSVIADDTKTVGDYAEAMHDPELHYPSGVYRLGPRSRAKDGGRGIVGPKFLLRAFKDLEDKIVAEVKAKAFQGIGH